jgi:glycosyltransferase involved in cell wall biosynthesis
VTEVSASGELALSQRPARHYPGRIAAYDAIVKVLIWHGWLLEGSGSNVYTARVAEVLRASGNDVVVVCQEPHPERYPWIDAWATLDANGPSTLTESGAERTGGRCVLLRPRIGDLLPVFVIDRYEGFATVRRFVDLTDEQLRSYLATNVGALRAAVAWHDSRVVIAGHAIPGPVIAGRALGPGRYVAKVHGSDIEYAIREQDRYVQLAHEGLTGARAVIGGSRDVLERCEALVPGISGLLYVIPPGVDTDAFRPRSRRDALLETADLLDDDPCSVRGRPASLDPQVVDALARRDKGAIDALAGTYDQGVPDPDAWATLRRLAGSNRPVVGYLGKLIPQKGVELLLAAREALPQDPVALIVGFGSHREWLTALAIALRNRDGEALEWLSTGRIDVDLSTLGDRHHTGDDANVLFTGRLDHRYAPGAVAAMDVLVVPSILDEAFGMVAAEGAAAGALPMVARHSGLAEVAEALEGDVGRPGLFSFEPGPGAGTRLAAGIDRLLSLPARERGELRRAVSAFVAGAWSWDRTAALLLAAAR